MIIRVCAIAVLCLSTAETAIAQIEINPVRVVLSSRQRDAEVTVHNPLNETVEATVQVGFKMLRTDTLGNRWLDSTVTSTELAHACHTWMKVFPQRIMLPPQSSRTIRLIILPPQGIADGEYWGRLEVSAQRIGNPAQRLSDTNAVVLNLNMRFNLGIPITYRQGTVGTGLIIDDVKIQRIDSTPALIVGTLRTGNSVYRGTLRVVLHDAGNTEILAERREFTNETEAHLRFDLPRLTDGLYKLDVESTSTRSGSARALVLPSPPLARSYQLQVSGTQISVVAEQQEE